MFYIIFLIVYCNVFCLFLYTYSIISVFYMPRIRHKLCCHPLCKVFIQQRHSLSSFVMWLVFIISCLILVINFDKIIFFYQGSTNGNIKLCFWNYHDETLMYFFYCVHKMFPLYMICLRSKIKVDEQGVTCNHFLYYQSHFHDQLITY